MTLTIGTLAKETGCSIPTIRYYEEIGLLPQSGRAANGHRFYLNGDIRRLIFIRRCRDFGFPIEQVRQLTLLLEDGSRPCVEVRDLAQHHLQEIQKKLDEMQALQQTLKDYVDACTSGCSDGQTRDCSIVENLQLSSTVANAVGTNGSRFVATELKRTC